MLEFLGSPITLASGERLPISPCVRAGDFLFVSGQLGFDDNGKLAGEDVATQTRACLRRLQNVLAEAGSGLDRVVKVTAWITAVEHFEGFNSAYREFFRNSAPARSTIVSGLVIPKALVEIEAVALRMTDPGAG
jgi:2-iminobutanoate/2-iminopropanoate deaminase